MDKYDETQFEEMKERFIEDKTFENWDRLYTKMRKDLEELKKQNKLQDERIRVKAILECAEQKKTNIAVENALPLVSLIFSTCTGILSVYYSNNLVQILQEKFVKNITNEEFVNNITQEEFIDNIEKVVSLLTNFRWILLIFTAILVVIAIVYCICFCLCKKRRNDIVYYKTKLNIIDMLIEEDANKQIEENC